MKQNLLRIGCAAAGLALAAGVFTSCSLLPTPSRPVSHPQQEEEPPKYDASSLRDGRLRLFSSYDSLGGNTILCGDKVVHQSPASETSYLLTDSQTGETNWFVCTWSDPDTAAGRRSGIFDRTGEALYTFDREYDIRLSGGVLVLTTPTSFAYSPLHDHAAGDVRVLDFASGTEYPVPENAYTCLVAGDRLAFGLYAPGDAAPDEENDDLYQYAAVQIQEKDGTVVYQNFHGLLYSLSAGVDDPLAPAGLGGDRHLQRGRHEPGVYFPAERGHRRGAERLCHLSPRGPCQLPDRRGQVSARGSGQRHDQHRAVRI